MFALSQLVDIPLIFRRLDALPRELATARQELWAASIQVDEAQRDYDEVRKITREEYTKKHPGSVLVGPLPSSDAMKKALGCLATWDDERSACEANLADLNDEMSALRAKINLITALTMGCQETSESILLRQLLNAVRSTPGPLEQPDVALSAART